ncbi:hypothetical protein O3M35_009198 [Rhynocoris fuscipes]|uniref:H15 domain-containing protein n=1 Tax=Rhynocoris fuscipes TaxID=488301 RepID=A0AAW1D1Y9_9HEMI
MKDQEINSNNQWQKWILDAIRKVRSQKQRPSTERICNAIRQHQNQSEDIIIEHLERLVNEGFVLKVINKGRTSYKDPNGLQHRCLEINKDTDLTKLVVKAVRELGASDGSTLKNIEKYIQQSNSLNLKQGVDLTLSIKNSLKKAVERSQLIHEGKLYKFNTTDINTSINSDKSPSKSPITPVKQQKSIKTDSNQHKTTPVKPKKTSTSNDESKVCYNHFFYSLNITY